MTLVSANSDGRIEFDFVVGEQHMNGYGTLHGGVIASLIDLVGSTAVIAKSDTFYGTSVDVSVTYVSSTREGSTVRLVGVCHKAGKSLAFMTVTASVGTTLIAKGSVTQFNQGSI
ncbi:HotDog domain-containing protein [Cladochytrium replicatum]|nr:HotDog domain-containing protein [Cladochytrium replicatum]